MEDFISLSYVGDKNGLLRYIGEQICEYCFGEGEVDTLDYVYANEPHQAYVGTRKCICQVSEPDYDDQDE